jgi:predicted regulator of Ras-like GTPase activity (Roadblock/LC7/MglB family)
MAMQGNLHDMSVADIIQVNCQDKKTARATIKTSTKQAVLFFKEGNVTHAMMDSLIGEEVIYQILAWDEGEFSIDVGEESPDVSIKRNWSGLLLEGAKRLDEQASEGGLELDLIQTPIDQKDELIKGLLSKFLESIPSADAIAIVGIDGYIKYIIQKNLIDESVFGATGAAILNLGKRSLGLLRMDGFAKALLAGDNNTIMVAVINKYTLLVAIFSAPAPKVVIDWNTVDQLMGDVSTLL